MAEIDYLRADLLWAHSQPSGAFYLGFQSFIHHPSSFIPHP
jgi:hypothetical protein